MTDEEGMKVCRAEIRRLKSTIRENREALRNAAAIGCQSLFEIWADFDDADTPDEVTRLIETSGMGPVDAVSFTAFCYGYYRNSMHYYFILVICHPIITDCRNFKSWKNM